jgi:hypothetical protein
MGRGDGRGRVAAPAAVDEAADGERGGDQGECRVGRPWQVAVLRRRRRGDVAWAGGWDRRGARPAPAGCRAEHRTCVGDGVAEELEWVDVASAVAGAAGPEPQAAGRPEGPEAPAEVGVGAAADGEVAEAQVGGDERAAADGDGQAVVRKRAGEGDAAGARGVYGGAGRSGDVDPAALPASERRARRQAEGADDAAAKRPAPGGARRRRGAGGGDARTRQGARRDRGPRRARTREGGWRDRGPRRAGGVRRGLSLPFARRRSPRRDEERHDEAGDRQRDEDQRVWAWGHAPTLCAVRRVPGECA